MQQELRQMPVESFCLLPCHVFCERSLSDQPAVTGLWTAFVMEPGIFDEGRLKPSFNCHPLNMLSFEYVVIYKGLFMQTLTKDIYKIQCLPTKFFDCKT